MERTAKGVVTRAPYNSLGQRTSVNDPNQGQWSFVYNALGEVMSRTDAGGITTPMTRDAVCWAQVGQTLSTGLHSYTLCSTYDAYRGRPVRQALPNGWQS